MTLYEALARGDAGAVRQLVTPPFEALPKLATFFDRVVGNALREIGDRWERGELGIDEEHRASYLIIEALDRIRNSIPEGREPRAEGRGFKRWLRDA